MKIWGKLILTGIVGIVLFSGCDDVINYSIIIRNTQWENSEGVLQTGDIGIAEDKIVKLGDLGEKAAPREINGENLMVKPASALFIDTLLPNSFQYEEFIKLGVGHLVIRKDSVVEKEKSLFTSPSVNVYFYEGEIAEKLKNSKLMHELKLSEYYDIEEGNVCNVILGERSQKIFNPRFMILNGRFIIDENVLTRQKANNYGDLYHDKPVSSQQQ